MGKVKPSTLAQELGLEISALSPAQVEVLKDRAEYMNFLRLLASLRGNFVAARWRGRHIDPSEVKALWSSVDPLHPEDFM